MCSLSLLLLKHIINTTRNFTQISPPLNLTPVLPIIPPHPSHCKMLSFKCSVSPHSLPPLLLSARVEPAGQLGRRGNTRCPRVLTRQHRHHRTGPIVGGGGQVVYKEHYMTCHNLWLLEGARRITAHKEHSTPTGQASNGRSQ